MKSSILFYCKLAPLIFLRVVIHAVGVIFPFSFLRTTLSLLPNLPNYLTCLKSLSLFSENDYLPANEAFV